MNELCMCFRNIGCLMLVMWKVCSKHFLETYLNIMYSEASDPSDLAGYA